MEDKTALFTVDLLVMRVVGARAFMVTLVEEVRPMELTT